MKKVHLLIFSALLSLSSLTPPSAAIENPRADPLAGFCPSWSSAAKATYLSGHKWQRSGGRNIYIEWTLSPSNLDGKRVVRSFSSDEEQLIRAAIAWWDSVFDTVDFREVSGDYASLKIGTRSGIGIPQSKYRYFVKSSFIQSGQISIPAETQDTGRFLGYKLKESDIRSQLGFLLGLNSKSEPSLESQSVLRSLYSENSCYPFNLEARWDKKTTGLVGTVGQIQFSYSGNSEIGITVLTPRVCMTGSFAISKETELAVNVLGQGVCTILVQARESFLPPSSEVLTLRTSYRQTITTNAIPKSLKVGKSFTLKLSTSARSKVSISNIDASRCKVQGMKITALKPGRCRLVLRAPETILSQKRFAPSQKTISLSISK